MQDYYEFFYDMFLNPAISGYFGPLALVLIGAAVAQKNWVLGVLVFLVDCLIIGEYLQLVEATPSYWWHIMILLLGGLFTCVFPLWNRR